MQFQTNLFNASPTVVGDPSLKRYANLRRNLDDSLRHESDKTILAITKPIMPRTLYEPTNERSNVHWNEEGCK